MTIVFLEDKGRGIDSKKKPILIAIGTEVRNRIIALASLLKGIGGAVENFPT